MLYKGIELKDIADTPQIMDPPKRMVVWSMREGHEENVREATVVAILPELPYHANVVCQESYKTTWATHCAEIPERLEKRATFLELAKWLATGKGLAKLKGSAQYLATLYVDVGYENDAVDEDYKIRRWDDTEWHEPTLEYMGLEDKQDGRI